MKINDIIKQLTKIKETEGNIEIIMTATTLQEGYSKDNCIEDVFESTVENIKVVNTKHDGKKAVKLFWQS